MISVKDLSFSYGKVNILKNISFDVEKGQCVGIIGSNGCGKSTLLSIISGSKKCIHGSVSFDENDKIGYVPQENPLLPDLSAKDNLLLWYKGSKKEFKKALDNDLINMLQIKSYLNKSVKKLSGGMKKRLSIAIALINEPSILILDEPSAALDLPCKADIQNYLQAFLKTGGSVIITTHDENELNLCDKLYIVKEGIIKEIDKSLRGPELVSQL